MTSFFDPLEVSVWRKSGDVSSARVEITLAIGGPTVSVDVDEFDRVDVSSFVGLEHIR